MKAMIAEAFRLIAICILVSIGAYAAKWVFGPPQRQQLTITIKTLADDATTQGSELPQPAPLLDI